VFAGKASAPAHAPYLHPCRQRQFLLSLELAYSGLHFRN